MLALTIVLSLWVALVTANGGCGGPFRGGGKCKYAPSDSCWPLEEDWNALNASLAGKLIKTSPPAAVCYPGPQQDLTACAKLAVKLTNSTYIAGDPTALDYPINDACPVVNYDDGDIPGRCSIGGSPVYTVNATSPEDVADGINFARNRNLRLVVRNTGHDILGRSTGAWGGSAFTVAGGYVWSEVYAESNKRGLIVVGGGDPSVSVTGGWAQGGGHSPASRDYGLGADQILEAQVVLANGHIVTANACQNRALLRAIRGGGGGSYGVVVSTTIKAYPTVPVVSQTIAMAPLSNSKIPEFMDALTVLYSAFPDLDDAGYSGYGRWLVNSSTPVFANFTTGYTHSIASFNRNTSVARKAFAPTARKLARFNGTAIFISVTYTSLPSYLAYYTAQSGVSSAVGTSSALGSRLLDRVALTASPEALREALVTLAGRPGEDTENDICLVSGGKVFENADDPLTGVNPAWRTSYLHHIVARGWTPGTDTTTQQKIRDDITYNKVAAMRKIAPRTGSYMNEGDRLDPQFLRDFYGAALPTLEIAKAVYDPHDLFYCPTCVGSERWAEDESGRLCLLHG